MNTDWRANFLWGISSEGEDTIVIQVNNQELEAELKHSGIDPRSLDKMEIHCLEKIAEDIREKGSYYFEKWKKHFFGGERILFLIELRWPDSLIPLQ